MLLYHHPCLIPPCFIHLLQPSEDNQHDALLDHLAYSLRPCSSRFLLLQHLKPHCTLTPQSPGPQFQTIDKRDHTFKTHTLLSAVAAAFSYSSNASFLTKLLHQLQRRKSSISCYSYCSCHCCCLYCCSATRSPATATSTVAAAAATAAHTATAICHPKLFLLLPPAQICPFDDL